MAHVIPSDLSRLALSGVHTPELETLGFLKAALSNDYTVFHGVHWSREYQGWTHFGEIDFVVLNRAGAVLLIEQKNGPIVELEGSLRKQYEDGDKDVAAQVHRSINKVRQKFQWQHGRHQSLPLDYLIYIPDHAVRQLNAAGLDASRIVDARDKAKLAERIEAILRPGAPGGDGWYEKVHEFFCQTFSVVPDIHTHIAQQERGFIRQTGVLASILADLEMNPFRLRVSGSAGSGKSLVARQFIERVAARGGRVLFVCFNRPLAERLRGHIGGAAGHVNTWHGFCDAFLRARGKALDFSRMGEAPGFWREVQEQVMAEVVPEEWLFDALVVDEGQDFEQDWLEILMLFLRDEADILWLEDPDQNLQGKAPVCTSGFVGYRSTANHRSPDSIARFIRDTLPFKFGPRNDLPGLGVGVHPYSRTEEQPRIAANVLQGLIRRGFSHDDIVVLTCRGVRSSIFSALEQIGGGKLRKFTGEYDDRGNQLLSAGRLTFESVYRFKGQEAPAVILVDVDPRPGRGVAEERLLYCGMTRATVRLDVIAQADNPANRTLFEAKWT
jgi:hypothetical protein